MDNFPNVCAPSGCSTQHQSRILKCDFGDGYKQRAVDGLNSHHCEWKVVWSKISCEDANVIERFLVDCQGVSAFLWTPPNQVKEFTVICDLNTLIRIPESGYESISASFTEVFDY